MTGVRKSKACLVKPASRVKPAASSAAQRQQGLQRVRRSDTSALRKSDPRRVLAAVREHGLALRYAAAGLRSSPEIVLAAVSKDGRALQFAAGELRNNHAIVLAAVSNEGRALRFASEELKNNPEVVLAAVSNNGNSLQYAAAEVRGTPEIVKAAVSKWGLALQFASVELKNHAQIVFTAVSSRGWALQYASEELRSNHEIVLAAVANNVQALRFAADTLLEEEAFAVDARKNFFLFKITALSGRSCILVLKDQDSTMLLDACCWKLGMERSGSETLLYGAEEVTDRNTQPWPGAPCKGAVIEYQLVRSKRPRVC
mmetsp:Transcript_50224/g.92787  ORF Transcript_50224/g.92787 Transcript_50224/m.92787 type:complete len:315 (+) Transcript_50224:72-1016(+)